MTHSFPTRRSSYLPLDFVQFTYNVLDREAEARLLPLAADRGQAVILNRPFRQKALIRQVQGHPLPDWAAEFGAASRSEEHTSELQSLMRISYAVFCLKKTKSKMHTTKPAAN